MEQEMAERSSYSEQIPVRTPNALVQLQAQYNHCGEAASEKCLSAATFVRRRERDSDLLSLGIGLLSVTQLEETLKRPGKSARQATPKEPEGCGGCSDRHQWRFYRVPFRQRHRANHKREEHP